MILWLLAALAGAAPLTLPEVLEAVDARVPDLAAAEAKLEEAEAKLLKARGAFDPVLGGKLSGYAGKYPREIAEAGLYVPTIIGADVEVAYGLGIGDFPAYDGDRETPGGGELRLRGTLPLLDGLGLPQERAQLLIARAGNTLADAQLADKRLSVRRKAAETYWKWASAGAKLAVEQDLLEQAETRNEALTREVEQGTRPRIDLLDNERVVLQRRDTVARATRDLEIAALLLSLWYRDGAGAPVVPTPDQVPALEAAAPVLPEADEDRASASTRPDVQVVEALLDAAEVERSRAGNALLPDLDLVGEAIRPVDPTEDPELLAGLVLKLPTLSRKERGERGRADAAVDGLQAVRRGTVDAARAETDAARVAIETAWQRVEWAREAEARAAEVVALEARRFELGGGDVFQLLARESNLASARKATVDALLDYQVALAAREAATGGS